MAYNNIIFYTNLFPTPNDMERGVFVYQLAIELNKKTPVTVICPLPWFPKWGVLKRMGSWYKMAEVPSKAVVGGITVYYPKYPLIPKISNYLHGFLMFLGTYRLTTRIVRENKKSIISGHWIYPDCFSLLLISLLNKLAVTVTARGCDINRDGKNKYLRALIYHTLNKAAHVITVSESLAEEIQKMGIPSERVSAIANGVNKEKFKPLDRIKCRKDLSVPLDRKVFVYVGQLVPVKDHHTFIEGLAELIKECKESDAHAYLVGEGYLKDELINFARACGISSNVHFIGHQSHDRIPMWIGASDVVCLTSIREGRPNAVIEALACGRPVVASNVGGIPELITKDNGIIFRSGDYLSLMDALKEGLSKEWEPDKVKATVDHLSWEQSSRLYLELFESIAQKQGV